jgi:hypothetical protein
MGLFFMGLFMGMFMGMFMGRLSCEVPWIVVYCKEKTLDPRGKLVRRKTEMQNVPPTILT